jgi:hypothetical protein
METDFGGCLSVIYEAIQLSTFVFLMRLLTKFKKKPRAVQIASHLVWDVVGEEGEVGRKVLVLVLVDANQKVLGVVLMMVVLEELEAEVGVAKVESPEEAEVLDEVEVDLSK